MQGDINMNNIELEINIKALNCFAPLDRLVEKYKLNRHQHPSVCKSVVNEILDELPHLLIAGLGLWEINHIENLEFDCKNIWNGRILSLRFDLLDLIQTCYISLDNNEDTEDIERKKHEVKLKNKIVKHIEGYYLKHAVKYCSDNHRNIISEVFYGVPERE